MHMIQRCSTLSRTRVGHPSRVIERERDLYVWWQKDLQKKKLIIINSWYNQECLCNAIPLIWKAGPEA